MTNLSFGLIVIDVGADPVLAWVKSMIQLAYLPAETIKPDGEGAQIVRRAQLQNHAMSEPGARRFEKISHWIEGKHDVLEPVIEELERGYRTRTISCEAVNSLQIDPDELD